MPHLDDCSETPWEQHVLQEHIDTPWETFWSNFHPAFYFLFWGLVGLGGLCLIVGSLDGL